MNSPNSATDRRAFLRTAAAASAVALASPLGAAEPVRRRGIKLGYDNFAVRAMKWNARQLIDWAAQLKTDSLFITDFGPFEGKHDDAALGEIRKYAADHGLQTWLGSWSICPTSRTFKKDWGTAGEHLALGIRMAKALGSPVFRVILGNGQDRTTEGGIEARIADTVKVLKAGRGRAVDAGVKIAIENHGGDMQAWELATLIEAAGRDFVGANLDSGNAAWTMEDPVENLEILGPYTLTTSLRDSAVWETPNGVTVQWCAMGEGTVDLKAYFDRFEKLCPNAPVHIETISGFPRELPIYKNDANFWKAWPKMRGADLAKFIALAKRGKSIPPHRSANNDEEQAYQRGEIERSIKYCKESLGLGLK
jgi:sugar phosphate isomerase/epimerase